MNKLSTSYDTLSVLTGALLYDKYFHLEMFLEDNRNIKELTKKELMYIARQYINYHKMTGDLPINASFDLATGLIIDEVLNRFDYKGKVAE